MGAKIPAAATRIDLIRVMDLLQAHLTPALCQAGLSPRPDHRAPAPLDTPWCSSGRR